MARSVNPINRPDSMAHEIAKAFAVERNSHEIHRLIHREVFEFLNDIPLSEFRSKHRDNPFYETALQIAAGVAMNWDLERKAKELGCTVPPIN